jgi:predicted Zn-dependent protease
MAVTAVPALTARPASAAPIDSAKPGAGLAGLESELEAIDRLYRSGRFDHARTRLELAALKFPDLPPVGVMMARLHLAAGRLPAARAELEAAAAASPNHPDVYLTMADAAAKEGRRVEALLLTERVAALAESDLFSQDRRLHILATALSHRAAACENTGDWDGARKELYELLKLRASDGVVRARYGRALFKAGLRDEAAEVFRRLAADDTDAEPADFAVGRLLLDGFDPRDRSEARRLVAKRAEDSMRRALAGYNSPDDRRTTTLRADLASWLIAEGRGPEAAALLEEADRLRPGDAVVARLRALAALAAGRHAEAAGRYAALQADNPADFEIADRLAICLIEDKDEAARSRALQLAQLNLRLYPEEPRAHATAGWLLYKLGRPADAERHLRAARSGRGPHPEADYYLAHLLADRPDRRDDVKALLKSAADAPGLFPFRRQVAEWLTRLESGPPTPPAPPAPSKP